LISTPAAERASLIEARALRAALALFQGDLSAVDRFDVSVRGFFLSFRAILYALPALALTLVIEHRQISQTPLFDPGTFNDVRFIAAETIGFVAVWLLNIGVLLTGARLLGRGMRFVPAAVAMNWASVLAANLLAVPALLLLPGVVPDILVGAVFIVLLVIVLRYQVAVLRAGLRINPLPAMALVAAMLAVELLSAGLVDGLSYVW
jgi:hypothetical protein